MKRESVHAEGGAAGHEEGAFTPGADAALGHGSEHGGEEIRKGVNLKPKSQPGEIVLLEPGTKAEPIDPKAESGRQKPEGQATQTFGHWASLRFEADSGNHHPEFTLLSRAGGEELIEGEFDLDGLGIEECRRYFR